MSYAIGMKRTGRTRPMAGLNTSKSPFVHEKQKIN